MRKIVIIISLLVLVFGMADITQAVPSLGVATDVAYIGESGQSGLEAYQDYFVNTFIADPTPGVDDHGFAIGPSGNDLIVFTNYTNVDIYLLTTSFVNVANSPTLDGSGLTLFPSSGQFDGYQTSTTNGKKNYYGVNLGTVDLDWISLPSNPFVPGQFYALNVELDYIGSIASTEYFFSVADLNKNGTLEANGSNHDDFSPKTTSSHGWQVPEPSSLWLMGLGLLGLGFFSRKKQ